MYPDTVLYDNTVNDHVIGAKNLWNISKVFFIWFNIICGFLNFDWLKCFLLLGAKRFELQIATLCFFIFILLLCLYNTSWCT